MSVVRYQPWNLLNRLQGDIDRVFASRPGAGRAQRQAAPTSDWVPAIDIREEDTRYVIYADVPGVDPAPLPEGEDGRGDEGLLVQLLPWLDHGLARSVRLSAVRLIGWG